MTPLALNSEQASDCFVAKSYNYTFANLDRGSLCPPKVFASSAPTWLVPLYNSPFRGLPSVLNRRDWGLKPFACWRWVWIVRDLFSRTNERTNEWMKLHFHFWLQTLVISFEMSLWNGKWRTAFNLGIRNEFKPSHSVLLFIPSVDHVEVSKSSSA